jgi:hypothetical protein
MRTRNTIAIFMGFILFSTVFLMGQTWKLPQGIKVKDAGPRTYRFTVDYSTADVHGRIIQLERVKGDYTRGLPDNKAVWENVTVADSTHAGGPLGPERKQEFMNGFQYDRKSFNPMSPDFFKDFPETAVNERNLVWDTVMLENFGQEQFEHLALNQAYHFSRDQDVNMPGVGKFHNRVVQLMWIGKSYRNGQNCALIEYRAYFNPLEMAMSGMTFEGRSHFWGLIWVSLKTKQIEYGTLYEDVLGEMKPPGSNSTQIVNTFRSGIFEPLAKN